MTDKLLFSEIENECLNVISSHATLFLKDKVFNVNDADFMIDQLNKKIMRDLTQISEYFKYVLSIVLLKTESSGLTQNTSSFYDVETDGIISEKFAFSNIACIINLFCFSI